MAEQQLASPEELVGRLFEAAIGGIDILSVYLGEKLGYYQSLDASGPATPGELAQRTGTHPRYAQEWLEQQATTQILAVDDPTAPAEQRRYSLPEGYADVLVNPLSPAFVAPMGRFLKVMGACAEKVLEVYRNGNGLSWGDMGADAREAQAAFNRPFYAGDFIDGYLKKIPGLDAALAAPGARVAEIGPGGGWALIALAQAFPAVTAEGFDLDEASVDMARANVAAAGLADRVSVHCQDAARASGEGKYDLVMALECIHDMSNPVGVLRTMKALAKPGGTVLVMDERVGERFGAFGDPIERLMYGASIFICLPDGMSAQPSAATGTVMRPSTLRRYAVDAGFADIEVLPLEHDLFRFYRLVS